MMGGRKRWNGARKPEMLYRTVLSRLKIPRFRIRRGGFSCLWKWVCFRWPGFVRLDWTVHCINEVDHW